MIEEISGIELLAAALEDDEFYDFHDAEIVSVNFDRNDKATIEVTLQISRRVGEFESENKTFDRFRNFDAVFKFSNARLLRMNRFGHQNVVEKLVITRGDEKYLVHFKEIFGCDVKFECEKMDLIGVNVFETRKAKYLPDWEKIRTAARAAQKSDKSEH